MTPNVRNFDAGVAALLALEGLDVGVEIHDVTSHRRVRREELLALAAEEAAAGGGDEADDLVRIANFFEVFKVSARVAFIVIVV